MEINAASDLGVLIGHYTDRRGGTGCTVVLCARGATGGVAVRGGGPCTRETDIFRPSAGVDPRLVHGVLLSGGSVFGLAAADGVVRFLSERGIGLQTGQACIPIVAAAGLYDLGIASAEARPDAASGYAACVAASADLPEEGTVGAGTGATVGKAGGMARCTKGGVGANTALLADGVLVHAIVVVNAFGEVVDPANGKIIAGVRWQDRPGFEETSALLNAKSRISPPLSNTTLAVVVTNAPLTKEEASELAAGAHDGLAQTIRPAHTRADGDTVFVLSTSSERGTGLPILDLIAVQYAATRAVANAVLRAVQAASSLAGIPAASEHRAG